MKKDRVKNGGNIGTGTSTNTKTVSSGRGSGDSENHQQQSHQQSSHHQHEGYECVALHISPDLGERIMLSGERALLDEVFPETNQALLDARSSVAWNQHDARHVIRFPLNGYCKLNSVQAITRLLNAGFRVAASNGGGVEGQQFSEYLFVRKVFPV
ncbi:BTB/POZ domain-containing protein kctd15 [Blattella germanica]|nr:BTB/POZ domain-containing protein kctd15 [Blattella germanica]